MKCLSLGAVGIRATFQSGGKPPGAAPAADRRFFLRAMHEAHPQARAAYYHKDKPAEKLPELYDSLFEKSKSGKIMAGIGLYSKKLIRRTIFSAAPAPICIRR